MAERQSKDWVNTFALPQVVNKALDIHSMQRALVNQQEGSSQQKTIDKEHSRCYINSLRLQADLAKCPHLAVPVFDQQD